MEDTSLIMETAVGIQPEALADVAQSLNGLLADETALSISKPGMHTGMKKRRTFMHSTFSMKNNTICQKKFLMKRNP